MKCAKLKDEIGERNHRGRQGRRAAGDTARWNFIDRSVLPSLKRGKLPSEYDQKVLFLGSQRGQSLSKPHRQELALWAQQQQKRNLASQEEALNPRFRQDTLKSYLTKVATQEQTTAMKKGRAKLAYRFTFGDKKDKTLHHVQRTDPSYLRWLFGPENCFEDDESPFTWEFELALVPRMSALRRPWMGTQNPRISSKFLRARLWWRFGHAGRGCLR